MASIQTRHLFELTLPAGGLHRVGITPDGERRVGLIDGGVFRGERLKGLVLPGAADWIRVRHDATVTMDVRLVLETDDKAQIAFTYRGLRHGPPEVMARLGRGEPVDPTEYYLRAVGTLETSAPKYDWLNRVFVVGTGRRPPEGALYDFFEVL
jgi:hypothetical protein